MSSAEAEARRALNRLLRSAQKALRELGALEAALKHAEADDFPQEEYGKVRDALEGVVAFGDDEGERLRAKTLQMGGLEPGRVRRSSDRSSHV